MENLTLIVLAGGVGKRFWPLTTNKAIFPFFGTPMFTQTITGLPKTISRMIIVTNQDNNAAIRDYHFSIETSTVIQVAPTGMADAILACRDVISHGPLLIMNVDDVVDPALIAQMCTIDAFGATAGWKTDKHGPFGYLQLEGDIVKGIIEKPDMGKEPSPYINIVCDYMRDGKEFFDEIEKTKSTQDDIFEKAITNLMTRHEFVFVPYKGYFSPLKYPWNVLDVMQTLAVDMESYKGKNVDIKKNVIIEGPVYIEDNVKIFENTKIIGPTYIGKNTIIGNNCIIRASHIGADSVVGFNCDIVRSYIGNNCWFHSNYIGDSVLEGNISMGAGANLANLRLDDGEIYSFVRGNKIPTGRNKLGAIIGLGVRIGVNVSVMPGVKIGKNSFIGSGVVLDRDLDEGSFCVAKSEFTIIKNSKNAPVSREAFKKKI